MSKKRTQKSVKRRRKSSASAWKQHKRSIVLITAIVALLTGVLAINSISLWKKNEVYKQQEAELKEQIKKEKARTKEVEDYEEYVKTDEYIKDVAEDKLGLVDPNEIIFKPAE